MLSSMGRLYRGGFVDCAYMRTDVKTNCNADFMMAIQRGWIFQELSSTQLHQKTVRAWLKTAKPKEISA